MSEKNTKLIRDFYEAISRKDYDKAMECLSDNVEYRFALFNQSVTGKERAARLMRDWHDGFPQAALEVTEMVVADNGGAAELSLEGVHSGPLFAPWKTIHASNRRVKFGGCEIFLIKDGKISSIHSYADGVSLFRQIGEELGPVVRAA